MQIKDILYKPIILRPIRKQQMADMLVILFSYDVVRSSNLDNEGKEVITAKASGRFLNIDESIASGIPSIEIGQISSTEEFLDCVATVDPGDANVLEKLVACNNVMLQELARIQEHAETIRQISACLRKSLDGARNASTGTIEIRDENLLICSVTFKGNVNVIDLFFNKFQPEMEEILDVIEPSFDHLEELRTQLTNAFIEVARANVGEELASKIEIKWNDEFLKFQIKRAIQDDLNDDESDDETFDAGEIFEPPTPPSDDNK